MQMLSRKDYQEIAEILKEGKTKEDIIDKLIFYFKQDNPNFLVSKFRTACGQYSDQ